MNDLATALFMLLATSNSNAEEAFLSYGVGTFASARDSGAETKVINGGYRLELINGFYWQFKSGYWKDMSGDPTRKDSLYFSTGPTMLIDLRPVEIRTGIGLSGITNPDSYLGGYFPQFNEELYVGGRDKNGNGIGVKYEHISSAGIIQPNVGRDFLILEISTKW